MLITAYLISITLMIFLPAILAGLVRRKSTTPWLLFSIGSLTFILSQVVHIPLNGWLADLGLLPGEGGTDLPLWRVALTLGLTAGICEELTRAVGYLLIRKLKPGWMRFFDSVMLGLGHGGIESMLFGGLMVAATISALLPLVDVNLNTLGLLPDQLEVVRLQIELFTQSPLNALLPLIERLIAITAHVTFSIMVWKAFAGNNLRHDWYFIPLAVLYHLLVDFIAVWMAQNSQTSFWLNQAAFAGAMVPGWIWVLRVRGKNHQTGLDTEEEPAQPGALWDEMKVFFIALAKEIRQLWRTKRLLVIAAVFLVFGMGSPLIAKFTPLMIGSIDGAEMFADLIPDPTANDAMTQYIKNITQFGLILAILLGMGAVVGEKESNVIAMVMSKPMPRWAFITSKLAAQVLMYFGGFILGGVGAFYYTVVLFGGLDARGFLLLNGLLFLWLIVFSAISLFASTLAKSTPAAGGIGLLISVIVMLAGSIPQIGPLFPGGLIGWASLVGQSAAGVEVSINGANSLTSAANGGAAASAVVIILMTLILTFGVFEQQDL